MGLDLRGCWIWCSCGNTPQISGNEQYSAHVTHSFVIVPAPWREVVSWGMGFVGNLASPFAAWNLGWVRLAGHFGTSPDER